MSIKIITADITTLQVDAVINAANTSLMGGGGVDGAIHRAGGPAILGECRRILARQGGCPTGSAVVTTAGDLAAEYVIHTVGPVYTDNPEAAPKLLASCYNRSLEIASRKGCSSVAFPSISTGVYGYPVELASRVAMEVLFTHDLSGNQPRKITMCCFSEKDREVYATALARLTL